MNLNHETSYRGEAILNRLASMRLTLCGVGAIGSNLADTLIRQGAKQLRLIDRDKVEESNLGTQIYALNEVGAWKTEALKNRFFRSFKIEVESINKELIENSAAKFLKESDLILDLFDNSISRQRIQTHARILQIPCLHVGLFADYAEIIWDDWYRVPNDSPDDLCDYPLARNLVLLAVSVAAEAIFHWLIDGSRKNWSITLKDLSIQPLEI